MFRAFMTITAAALYVIVICPPALLLGLVYPSQWLVANISRWWAAIILWIAGVRLTIEGREHIAGPSSMFLMGNHQSALDIPIVIIALRGQVRFLAKDTLFRIPVFGS